MTLAEYSMTAFALLNGGRIVAYVPQIMCIYRDRNGAEEVSLTTWAMFAAANLATVSYSLAVSGDLVVASVFALNAACCLAITSLVAYRRLARVRRGGWTGFRVRSRPAGCRWSPRAAARLPVNARATARIFRDVGEKSFPPRRTQCIEYC